MGWVPLSLRGTEQERSYQDTLHEGVPRHMEPSLVDWLQRTSRGDVPTIRRIERRLRVAVHEKITGPPLPTALEMACLHDENFFLAVVDALLAEMAELIAAESEVQWAIAACVALQELLEEAGSAWRVAGAPSDEHKIHLERRVDVTAQTQADSVVSSGTHAGRQIADAWAEAFGRSPDTADAYRHAVLAVEACACPFFIPNDQASTLGKAINHLKTKPERYTIAGMDRKAVSGETLLRMLETLWTNQPRHAEPGGAVPPPPTVEATQAAVILAVTLVQLFQSGVVQPAA